MTRVPVKGTMICWVFLSIISFFLNLEELTKVVSLGNLMTYACVDAGVIALRLKPENGVSKDKFAWLYLLFWEL